MSITSTAGVSASECSEQRHQSVRRRRAVLDQPRHRATDPRLQCRIGVEPRARRGAAIGHAIETEEGCIRQSLREAHRQSRLAAAQRTDDVGERADVVQLEALAAPWPGQIERHLDFGGGLQQAHQLAGFGRPAAREIGAQLAHLRHRAGEIAPARFQRRLMPRQCGLKRIGIAALHARDLGEAEAQCAQGRDLTCADHLSRPKGSPSRGGADRRHQPALLPEAQRLDGNAETLCGFGRIEERTRRRKRSHGSPRSWLTALLIEASPGSRSRVFAV